MLKFDVEKTVLYWFESAEYDMGVAEAMYEKTKYPYALFMGHLALEKLLKALVVKLHETCSIYAFVAFIGSGRQIRHSDSQRDNKKFGKIYGISF